MSNQKRLKKLSNLAIWHQEKCRETLDLQTAREHRIKSEAYNKQANELRKEMV